VNRIAAALSAFLDLPRIMADLEVTLRHLRSVVTGAASRQDDRLAASERGLWDALQVARFLRVSRSWVYQRAESGLLPARHVGALLRFDADAIREYARTGRLPDRPADERPAPPKTVSSGGRPKGPAEAPEQTQAATAAAIPIGVSPRPLPLRDPSRPQEPQAPAVQRDTLLGVREVAHRLRVSTATVYKLCERGDLPHTRVVNVIRVEPLALEEFISRRGSARSRAGGRRRGRRPTL
jgi:excisionase family DNA binding protein